MVKNYVDVTKEWLDNATPNSHEVENQLFFEYKGKKYFVDGKTVVLDYSEKEREVAEWLKNTFGGEIKMIPRVNSPDGIQTPDYLFHNLKFDLKEVNGFGNRVIDSSIKKKKLQSNNFILDISSSLVDKQELLRQAKRIYNTNGREWVNILIIKKNNTLIKVYKKRSFA